MIERTLHDGILTLRLAHRKASALDVEILDALQRELEGAATNARALILTGTGSIFSAGVDLFRLTQEGADYVRRFLPLLSCVVRTLFAFPRPVVAAANRHAIAGGCILVLAADARLMAAGSGRIGVPELLVGVPSGSRADPAASRGASALPCPGLNCNRCSTRTDFFSPRMRSRQGSLTRSLHPPNS